MASTQGPGCEENFRSTLRVLANEGLRRRSHSRGCAAIPRLGSAEAEGNAPIVGCRLRTPAVGGGIGTLGASREKSKTRADASVYEKRRSYEAASPWRA